MNRLASLLVAALVASFASLGELGSGCSAAEVVLVEAGVAKGEIVVGEKPARMAKLAAKELQAYVAKISGATLPIVAEPTAGATTGASAPRVRVFVGRSKHTEALKISVDGLENGAFRMVSGSAAAGGGDWLALLGPDEDYVPIEPWGRKRSSAEAARVNLEWDKTTGDHFWNNCGGLYARYHADLDVWDFDDTGTLNAVYEYLRSLGVRWYAPGELGEVVPKRATITVPKVDREVVPDFALRRFSYYTDHLGLGDVGIWNLRLGTHQAHKLIGVTQPAHGTKFVLWREEMKREHPEMYLLEADGKRNLTHKGTGVPCLSSAMLKEKQLKYSRAMFDHFKQPMLSIDMVDGYGGHLCNDPQCKARYTPERGWPGSMSDYVWGYLNDVALELKKSHPDRLVSGLAYSAYKLPPEKIERMSPNLALIECRTRSRMYDAEVRKSSRELRAAWLKKLPSQKWFTWDYYLYAVPEDVGPPAFYPRLIAEDLRELKGVSLGDTIEVYQHQPGTEAKFGYDPLAVEHLNIYVTSRLWWDCKQDVAALLDEYYTGFYGPAAAEMKRFVEYSEQNWMLMTQDAARIKRAFELLSAAQSAASSAVQSAATSAAQSAGGAAGEESVYAKRIGKIADLMKPLRSLETQLGRKHETDLAYRVLETWQTGGKPMKDKPLDGKLDLEYWPKVRVASLARLTPSTRTKINGQFQVLREGNMLYFGIRCEEPDVKNLLPAKTDLGPESIYAGDYVSLYLETPSRSYYELTIDPNGRLVERDLAENAPPKWASGARAAVHRGADFWSIEIRLPIAGEGARILDPATGIDGNQPKELFPWYFNVCRRRARGSDVELTAYSPTGTEEFRKPEKFAKLWGK